MIQRRGGEEEKKKDLFEVPGVNADGATEGTAAADKLADDHDAALLLLACHISDRVRQSKQRSLQRSAGRQSQREERARKQ
jgi:hypothetical protein